MKKVNVPLLGLINPLLLGGIIMFLVFGVTKLINMFSSLFNFSDNADPVIDQVLSDQQDMENRIVKTRLTKDSAHYTSIAQKLFNLMKTLGGSSSADILPLLSGLNDEELKMVYVRFGVRKNQAYMFTLVNGSLIDWFEAELSNYKPWDWDGYDKVKKVWKNTGLWP